MVALKDREQQTADGLSADLLSSQATLAAPDQELSDADLRRMLAENIRETAMLKQQIASMGMNPVAVAQGATTPAAIGSSIRLEEAAQKRDEEILRAAWALEPSVPQKIEPDDIERQVYARRFARWEKNGRQGQQPWFPPRRYQVNGVVVWLEVGRTIHVPESLSMLHDQTQQTPLLDLIPAGEGRMGYWVGDSPFGD